MPNVQATKALQKRNEAALAAFHKYYSAIYHNERWHESLFPALCEPTRHAALINRFADFERALELVELEQDRANRVFDDTNASLPLVVTKQENAIFPQPVHDMSGSKSGLFSHWLMDLASVIAAVVLQVKPEDTVLDMCASPGGKSIALAQMLFKKPSKNGIDVSENVGHLHSNEMDQNRNKRLGQNLQSYLPKPLFEAGKVKVLRIDGTSKQALNDLPFGKQGYDKVLIDAPCSSERHIIHAHVNASASKQVSQELANWKASHSTTLAKTQAALLMTAFKALKIDGALVYATCSLSNEENDEVVDRAFEALKRLHKKVNLAWDIVVDRSFEQDPNLGFVLRVSEQTRHGRIALPDLHLTDRWGPLYFARMRKVARTQSN